MFQRVALFAAGLSAALVVAAGLALAGAGNQAAAPALPIEPAAATVLPDPTPQVQEDIVYLTPKAAPQVIVTKVVKTKPAPHGDDEGEGGGDD